ncbi:hypothetical protein N9C20_00030 [Luminiphilus sp.]|nr:hypothetical protein [Luminiphilus sp.]
MSFDAEAYLLLERAFSDDATVHAKLFVIAEKYLRSRKPMPDYLANAFKMASREADRDLQLKALAFGLGLRSMNRRASQASSYDVEVYVSCSKAKSDHAALQSLQRELKSKGIDVGLTKLRELLYEGREARKIHDSEF